MSLAELMVAVAILSISVLAFVGAFKFITQSFSFTRGRTLATNLAQEKIETLKDIPYYGLLVSTANAYVTCKTSNDIRYDLVNYIPEQITIGGIAFNRYTYVSMAQMSGSDIIGDLPAYPDTGLKKIDVAVTWVENGVCKMHQLTNLLENPYVNPLDSTVSGTVTKVGGSPLLGAVVVVQENNNWTATTDSTGFYSFRVSHGSYTLHVSSWGYQDNTSPVLSITQSNPGNYSPALATISTGTIAGMAWVNPGLVISQVVSGTTTSVAYDLDGGGSPPRQYQEVEYIELFNPTTASISITEADLFTKDVLINYWTRSPGGSNNNSLKDANFGFIYISSYVGPGQSYLIANTSYFFLGPNNTSHWINADAYWCSRTNTNHADPNCGAPLSCGTDCIKNSHDGAIELQKKGSPDVSAGGTPIDIVGWNENLATTARYFEGSPVNTTNGMGLGNQLVRFSSPVYISADTDSPLIGRAYDSGDNSIDFIYPTGTSFFTHLPYTTKGAPSSTGVNPMAPQQAVIAGVPGIGTLVAVSSDPYSASTNAWSQSVTGTAAAENGITYTHTFAPFQLQFVSTGTWEVDLASGSYFGVVTGVQVNTSLTKNIPNNVDPTTPGLLYTGGPGGNSPAAINLSSAVIGGFLYGTIQDPYGVALNNIAVQGGGLSKVTNALGTYFGLVPSTGTVNIVVNSPSAASYNTNYVTQSDAVNILQGALTSYSPALAQAGKIMGYATSGTTPLPNIVIAAISGSGSQAGSGVTDTTGAFSMKIGTGSYTVQPVMDTGQSYTSSAGTDVGVPAVVAVGGTVNVGTFTITGALGTIAGTVRYNSAIVTTGALIVASTGTLSSSAPPAITGSSAPANAPIYAASSKADGTYSLPVRGGYTYNIEAYYPNVSGNTVNQTTKSYGSISVTGGYTVYQDISMP